ncbi:hypothetical protein [Bacillus sp. MRMR6]|uniref:hypothetical protein n=1 Tax=Bacillus sp. MRMR6 TaxID=1928617 RepID=UPI0009514461|nr:hypothetical protein [Bacillus sp. MRMR6]OLS33873.1 hypothetical protein BTR25_23720 [Bacillus sp. MRMR6]
MPILPQAIISAFAALGGERSIREIKDWIEARFGDRWKDIGTCMADMVSVSHGGSGSSQLDVKYRVLKKVSRGKYCLINNNSNREDSRIVNSDIKECIQEIYNEDNQQSVYHSNYFFSLSNDNILEVYTSKRLPYEPKGWQLELRSKIRSHLKFLRCEGVFLHALYKSMDQSFFDVENVLFYNVGPSAFSHLNIKTLLFERAFEQPSIVNEEQHYKHYQSYKIIEQDEHMSANWMKEKTLATWENVAIPKLSSEIKPHSIWYAMKTGSLKIQERINSNYYGLEVTIKPPIHTQLNLVSVIKPLLDGIISAFHHHDSSDIDEVVNRLNHYINLPTKEIEHLLLDSSKTILGPRNLIQPYRNGVKWNPEDDAFQFIKIKVDSQHQNSDWNIDGKIFSINS